LAKALFTQPNAKGEMDMISNLISSLIKWALILSACSGLIDATVAIRNRAQDATRIGWLSLTKLNQQFIKNGKIQIPKSREHREKPEHEQ